MALSSFLIRNITYPLWMMKDGDSAVLRYVRYFEYLKGLTPEQLQESQVRRLSELLTHAYEHTPYYRKIFDDAGLAPKAFKDISVLLKLPLLTKDIIRKEYDGLKADNVDPRHVLKATTGGSTGTPLAFLRDKNSIYLRKGQELYFDRWMGYEIGAKTALFVAASHFTGTVEHLKAKFRNSTCERLLSFNPYNITDEYMRVFLDQFRKFNPVMIKCFPNSLTIFADFLKRNSIKVKPVRSISCTGENLYPRQRELFAEVFGGEVFEKYGTRESGIIACECAAHEGMHIFTEGSVIELLDENGKPAPLGGMGRIVVTDLFNRAMPLIRYEIGDMAVASGGKPCKCGSTLPRIACILGRDRDIIVDSAGNPKPGYLFVEVINNLNLDAQFQIIQDSPLSLQVKIGKSKTDIDTAYLTKKFKSIVGEPFKISFEFTQDIPRDPSGKYRYVVSRIQSRWK